MVQAGLARNMLGPARNLRSLQVLFGNTKVYKELHCKLAGIARDCEILTSGKRLSSPLPHVPTRTHIHPHPSPYHTHITPAHSHPQLQFEQFQTEWSNVLPYTLNQLTNMKKLTQSDVRSLVYNIIVGNQIIVRSHDPTAALAVITVCRVRPPTTHHTHWIRTATNTTHTPDVGSKQSCSCQQHATDLSTTPAHTTRATSATS